MGVVMMALIACGDENSPETTSFTHDFPLADMSYYDIEGEHNFFEVTMYEALQLRYNEDFNGILYFGFPICPWCQAAVPLIHEASQITNVDIFYISRAHDLREGEWLDWDVEMAWWLYENGVPNMFWLQTTPDEDADEDEIENFEPEPIRPNINVPQIVHLRNGIIVDSHRGTFEGHDHIGEGNDRHLPELTDEEHAALLDIYDRIFFGTEFGCPALGDTDACD